MYKELIKWNSDYSTNYKRIYEIDMKYHYVRVSKWLKVKQAYNISKRNSLYDYCTDENGYHPYNDKYNPENGTYLDYFTYNGKNYAIEQFIAIGSITDRLGHETGFIENSEIINLSGYDALNYYNPIFIEIDTYGEHVRVYKEEQGTMYR